MRRKAIDRNTKQLLLLGVIVVGFRLFYVDLFSGLLDRFNFVLSSFILGIFRSLPITLLMIGSALFFAFKISRSKRDKDRPLLRILYIVLYVIAISLVITVLVNFKRITAGELNSELLWGYLKLTFMAAILINVILTTLPIVVIYYVDSSRQALIRERNKKDKARYQYNQLKRQLNPHFLFNSLNILDCLVHTDPSKASMFITKLAGVYRYMLGREDVAFVTLREELEFADMYIDLLKERFTEGLEVEIEVEEEWLSRVVIPCSVQIMIENAVKHNVVEPERVLTIRIYVESEMLVISNNLQPKLTKMESSGMGLKSIKVQYNDVFGRKVEVSQTDSSFEVRIPLVAHVGDRNE